MDDEILHSNQYQYGTKQALRQKNQRRFFAKLNFLYFFVDLINTSTNLKHLKISLSKLINDHTSTFYYY